MKYENLAKFCDFCIHKSFDPKTGIVCGKTNEKPNFVDSCGLFEESEESIKARKYIAENPVDPNRDSVKTSSGPDGTKSQFIGIVLVLAGVIMTILSETDAVNSGKGSYTIFIGLIAAGAFRILFPGK